MSMRTFGAVAEVIGRRTALRYLSMGIGASVLAACGLNNRLGEGPSTSRAAEGRPTRGAAAMAFAAFIRGKWKIESTTPGGDTGTGTATIDDGTWFIDWSGQGMWSGTWSLQGDRLALRVPERASSPDELADAAATNVPAIVSGPVDLFLPWQPPGHSGTGDGQKLEVAYDKNGGVLRVRHLEVSGSMTIHNCTRLT
ncbi:hypothetical protein [Nonomuraea sp. NPDC050783]|uniref:hypothetical protein n=1 Tax=Nonomuraea sp. NPDC050783 TaxID=3154634 RepID=UPI00346617D1